MKNGRASGRTTLTPAAEPGKVNPLGPPCRVEYTLALEGHGHDENPHGR